MAQVTDQAGLQAALAARDPQIQIAADFSLSTQVAVTYPVTFSSLSADTVYTLTKAASYYSYLIRVSGGGALTLQNIIIDGDKASHPTEDITNRSLIFVAGGALTVGNGAIIRNNHAYQEGGGIYISGSTEYRNMLLIEGSAKITGCSSRTSGGGVMAALRNSGDQVSVTGEAELSGNSAANGGGLYCRSYQESIGGTLTIGGNVKITDNQADSRGGGLYVSGYVGGASPALPLTLTDSVQIEGNQAEHGGGVYYYGANTGDGFFVDTGVQIVSNQASGNGGGVNITAVSGTLSVHMSGSGCALNDNRAGNGGGIFLNSTEGADLLLDGITLRGNQAPSGSGGGLWFGTSSTGSQPFAAQLTGVMIQQNSAGIHGGGIYFQSGSSLLALTVDGGQVAGNTAGQSGGGMLLNASGEVKLSNCIIDKNISGQSGGGFYLGTNQPVDSTVSLSSVTVTGNTAAESGGGLRFGTGQGSLLAALTDSVVKENRAVGNSGGGIWSGGAGTSLTVGGTSQITDNVTEAGNGGGIYFNSSTGGTLLLEDDVRIQSNTADTTSSASGNHGGGVCVVPGNVIIRGNVDISHNRALLYGGGLSLSSSVNTAVTTADFQGGAIHDNQTTGVGGGIYNTAGNRMEIHGTSIYGNQAGIGGAVYNQNGASVRLYDSASVGRPVPNTAALYAPGIYNGAVFETADQPDLANGLYLANRSSAARIVGEMEPGAVLQLNNSSYVRPNQEGTPIVVADAADGYFELRQQDAEAFLKPVTGFDGWEIRLNGERTLVLLAPIEYTITYENLMGARNPNPEVYTITSDTILLSQPEALPGYRFLGWQDEDGNPVTEIFRGSTGNLTLTAVWNEIWHTILYQPNSAEGSPPARWIPSSIVVRDGQSVILSPLIPERNGFAFIGWNTAMDGTGTEYQPQGTMEAAAADLELYAQWRAT